MKFSIITINYNNGDGLYDTIKSIQNQTFENFEHIIIDGGSTDNSLNVIKKFERRITYWVSEKDNGIYNAQNKGIQQSNGEYLIFLNSGDFLFDNQVLKDISVYCNNTDIIFGDINFKTDSSREYIQKYPDLIDFSFFLSDSLPHPCTAIRKTLFDEYGLYNEDIPICADWAFFIDMICKNGVSYEHIDRIISTFLTGGLSTNNKLVQKEKNDYLKDSYAAFYNRYTELLAIEKKYYIFRSSKLYKLLSIMLPKKFVKT